VIVVDEENHIGLTRLLPFLGEGMSAQIDVIPYTQDSTAFPYLAAPMTGPKKAERRFNAAHSVSQQRIRAPGVPLRARFAACKILGRT
jgi:hypothetical protein